MSLSPVMSRSRGSMRTFGCLAAIIVASVFSLTVQAQQPGGFGRGGPGGGFGGPGGGFGGPFAMLQREDVQQELELLEEQKTQVKAAVEKSRERMGELFRGAGGRGGGAAGGEGNDRRDELRDTMRKFNEEMQAEVDKILLPHQSKRLKQLEVQNQMRGRMMGALEGDLAKDLGISEEQQDKLREKAQRLETELRKKMAEVRKQMQDQLLADLSPEQRKQFNDLVGDPFEFKDQPPQGGFGGRGEGPGGNRDQGRGGNERRRRPDEQK